MKSESYESGNLSSKPNQGMEKKSNLDYLHELLRDQSLLRLYPSLFAHVDRLLDTEINKVRVDVFHYNQNSMEGEEEILLPEPSGVVVTLQEKVFIPVKDNPNYNFVGRLLGPGGMTAKHMERSLGCKIMIRGRGSIRDKKKEEQNLGKPNWEHLNEDLHVLLSVEDYQNRAQIRMVNAVRQIKKFLDEALNTPESEDKLKQMQLMELAARNEAQKQQWIAAHSCLLPQQAAAAMVAGNHPLMGGRPAIGPVSAAGCPVNPGSPFFYTTAPPPTHSGGVASAAAMNAAASLFAAGPEAALFASMMYPQADYFLASTNPHAQAGATVGPGLLDYATLANAASAGQALDFYAGILRPAAMAPVVSANASLNGSGAFSASLLAPAMAGGIKMQGVKQQD